MNSPFVPLADSSAAAMAGRPTAGTWQALTLETAGGVLRPGRASAGSVAEPSASAPSGYTPLGSSQPTVTLRRDGNTVTHISIRCACGELIELACVY